MMKIIGVVGLNGSGKDEVVIYLNKHYGVPVISIGDIVRDIAAGEHIEPTRENLDNFVKRYFDKFGQDYFIKMVVEIIRKNRDHWKAVGISGIRSLQDIDVIREAFQKDFILVHVYVTDPQTRYERIHRRGSQRDQVSYADFLHADQVSEDIFHIQESITKADYSLANDGSLEDLHHAIENLIQNNKLLS